MKQPGRDALFLGTALLLCSALSGCVANRAYRERAPVLHEYAPEKTYKYSLAFVEFDDVGEMFRNRSEITKDPDGTEHDNTELGQTIREIERINEDVSSYPVFVVFIHGWHNNASDSSGNVWGFRYELQQLAEELNDPKNHKPDDLPRPVMGIFLGWRGEATNLPVAKDFSFWNRKNTATRIPGAHLTEALRRITLAAKSNPEAKCVVVGHSFGGLVLERTLTQAMVEMIVENKADLEKIDRDLKDNKIDEKAANLERKYADERLQSKVPDLTVLLNEAGPATEAKEFLTFLIDEKFDFFDSNNVRYPLFLSLTSTGDTATHIIFPVGQFLGKHGLSTRKYEEKDEFGETDQNHHFLHTTANSPHLVNHTVAAADKALPECKVDTTANSPHLVNHTVAAAGKALPECKVDRKVCLGGKTYYVCADNSPEHSVKNTIPYWVMQIPTEFVPDHSTVFKPELRALLEAFIQPVLATAPRSAGVGLIEPSAPKGSPVLKLQRRKETELKQTDQKPGP